jgi:DHA1 family bicyclomycin/chloramphenicol resistance-like MFS transporter
VAATPEATVPALPIVAPTMGGLLLLVGSWRLIFGAMLALCVVLLARLGRADIGHDAAGEQPQRGGVAERDAGRHRGGDALIAGAMGVATLVNARLVRRLGMRRLSHGGTIGLCAMAALQLAVILAFGGRPPLPVLILTLGLPRRRTRRALTSVATPIAPAMSPKATGKYGPR